MEKKLQSSKLMCSPLLAEWFKEKKVSNYTKLTSFTSKDSLTSGSPSKLIRGSEIDAEYDAIETAVNSKANASAPTFTGTLSAANLTVSGTFTGTINGGTY